MGDKLAGIDQVDLAHESSFRLAGIEVIPSTRELLADGGVREVIEPRVMQVLVVLARAAGATVSRDDLVRSCWEGRVVGDDAINRVISRLRRVADGIGARAFRIETITKVGYRLILTDPVETTGAEANQRPVPTAPGIDRRWVIGGASALVAIGGTTLWRQLARPQPAGPVKSPQLSALFEQGLVALRQTSNAGNQQACGLFRRATEIAPGDADAWGALGMAHAVQSHTGPPQGVAAGEAQARSAIARARSIDPDNPWAQAATGLLLPRRGRWPERRAAFESSAKALSTTDIVLVQLAELYASTGEMAKAATTLEPLFQRDMPSNFVPYFYGLWLWSAGRLIEADNAVDRGRAIFPLSFALWFLRFYIYCYTGRAAMALAMAADDQGRPPEIASGEFDHVVRFAQLMQSPDPAGVDMFLKTAVARAHEATGQAENAMQFAAALGRSDIAFAVADALYFDRGFTVPAIRFGGSRGYYSYLPDRRTYWLFMPPTSAMRRDPRFAVLMHDLGLDRYWQAVGEQPDYMA